MKNSDNQLAFPQGSPDMVGSGQSLESVQGMTLRDYFAAKAMQGMLAATEQSPSMSTLVNSAYAIADAMLEARKQ